MKLDPKDPYAAIWLYLTRVRLGREAREALAGSASQMGLKTWPKEVIGCIWDRGQSRGVVRCGGFPMRRMIPD